MKVSYCSGCKGRLWQLKQTLNHNLEALRYIDAEWIIVDYNCPDQTAEVVSQLAYAQDFLNSGKLKIYRLTRDIGFSMPICKNLPAAVATGEMVFSLDIDNFIGTSFDQIAALQPDEFIWSNTGNGHNGTMGRVGVNRAAFYQVGGYDLELFGAGCDDINLVQRLKRLGYRHVQETGIITPVFNTKVETARYLPQPGDYKTYYRNSGRTSFKKLANAEYVVNPQGMVWVDQVDLSEHLVRVMP